MPTASGWRLLIFSVAAFVGGRAFGLPELHVAGAAASAAVLLALVTRLVHPSRLSVNRTVSASMVAVSEPVQVSLSITNRSRLRSPTARVHEPASDGSEHRLMVAALGRGASVVGHYRLPTARRGVLEIGPCQLEDIDGLGLARRRRRAAGLTRVVVHPPVEDLGRSRVPPSDDLAATSEFARRAIGLESDEFDILRPYVSGDDPRNIHWRSTARFGDLMVRRFQPARPGRLTVVIDTRPPGDRAAAQDLTASVAASIASAVLRAGDAVRVVTTDGRATGLLSQPSHTGEALEFLALLAGGRPDIEAGVAGDGSVVVAVTARPEAVDDAEDRLALARRLGASLVVSCGPGQRTSPGPGADPSGGWIHLTGPGQLAGLWRMPEPARVRAAAAP